MICGLDGDRFGSLPDELISKFSEQFKQPEMFFMHDGDIKALPVKIIKSSIKEQLQRPKMNRAKSIKSRRKGRDLSYDNTAYPKTEPERQRSCAPRVLQLRQRGLYFIRLHMPSNYHLFAYYLQMVQNRRPAAG